MLTEENLEDFHHLPRKAELRIAVAGFVSASLNYYPDFPAEAKVAVEAKKVEMFSRFDQFLQFPAWQQWQPETRYALAIRHCVRMIAVAFAEQSYEFFFAGAGTLIGVQIEVGMFLNQVNGKLVTPMGFSGNLLLTATLSMDDFDGLLPLIRAQVARAKSGKKGILLDTVRPGDKTWSNLSADFLKRGSSELRGEWSEVSQFSDRDVFWCFPNPEDLDKFRLLARRALIEAGILVSDSWEHIWLDILREWDKTRAEPYFTEYRVGHQSGEFSFESECGTFSKVFQASGDYCEHLSTVAREMAVRLTIEPQDESATTSTKIEPRVDGESTADVKANQSRMGAKIDRLRLECGWSIDDLSNETGIAKKLIIGHIQHKKGAYPSTMKKYADALTKGMGRDVTVLELLNPKTPPKIP